MTRKEKAQTIRANLKAAGYTARQVSVRCSPGCAIDVTIKDPAVPADTVKAVAQPHEEIDRCEATGEILAGGNTFVFVRYDETAIGDLVRLVEQKLSDEPGQLVELARGWVAMRDTGTPLEQYRYWRGEDGRQHVTIGKANAAGQITRAMLSAVD